MPWEKGRPRGNPDEPKEKLKRPGPMLKSIVDRVEGIAERRGWTKRDAWEMLVEIAADAFAVEDGVFHRKLYEIRIYEPAVDSGLFPRPERWRYTNAYQHNPSTIQGKPLRQVGTQYDWWFVNGVADVYDSGTDAITQAYLIGEIDEGRVMEKDRFVALSQAPRQHH